MSYSLEKLLLLGLVTSEHVLLYCQCCTEDQDKSQIPSPSQENRSSLEGKKRRRIPEVIQRRQIQSSTASVTTERGSSLADPDAPGEISCLSARADKEPYCFIDAINYSDALSF